ncbi:hypothetical protein A3K55_02005 [Candidatus Shapirobacteria bacterium RBG_13_44_7]|uniref:Uncharacterized protein n=1 Tax=Candidatus Shapirobacteria bacterium RBG_13_44_7 TaxID=1802149 RepID=A0A1F7SHL5_9BACT|nr:MAG: hypothetical protein A3K55_02005 [Candidatus Shapirobacteria bacterium RBG_13_44_7]
MSRRRGSENNNIRLAARELLESAERINGEQAKIIYQRHDVRDDQISDLAECFRKMGSDVIKRRSRGMGVGGFLNRAEFELGVRIDRIRFSVRDRVGRILKRN